MIGPRVCTGGEASHEPRLWALGTNSPCYKSRFTSGSPVTHAFPVTLPLLSALLRAAVTVQGGNVWSLMSVSVCGGSGGQQEAWGLGK